MERTLGGEGQGPLDTRRWGLAGVQGRGGGVECEGESECRAGAAVPGDPRVVDPPPLHPGRTPLRDSSACCFLEASAVPPLGGLWGGVMLRGDPSIVRQAMCVWKVVGGLLRRPFPPPLQGRRQRCGPGRPQRASAAQGPIPQSHRG